MTKIRRFVLDRFEGDSAVLMDESNQPLIVARTQLPSASREGDYLRVTFSGARIIEAAVDHAETENARQRIEEKLKRLRRGDSQKP